MAKGSQFERDLCRRLSEWWTAGARDDVFWRTAGSGGRATVRRKRGKMTAGAAGDIMATDPLGVDLMQLVTIECKRGYTRATIHDLVDELATSAVQIYESWIQQAAHAAQISKTPYWWVIHQRTRRVVTITFPRALRSDLYHVWTPDDPDQTTSGYVIGWGDRGFDYITMPLDRFLAVTTPSMMRRLQSESEPNVQSHPAGENPDIKNSLSSASNDGMASWIFNPRR